MVTGMRRRIEQIRGLFDAQKEQHPCFLYLIENTLSAKMTRQTLQKHTTCLQHQSRSHLHLSTISECVLVVLLQLLTTVLNHLPYEHGSTPGY